MKNDYAPLPDPIPQALMDRVAKLGSAMLCDGMNGLGLHRDGCLDSDLMPVDPESVMIGTACTVETELGDNFPIHVAIYQGKPGYVLMVAGGGCTDRAYLGDLLGGAARATGLNGIVVDGCVRDRLGLKELGLPVFAKGYCQRSPLKQNPGRINAVVMCGGVRVKPGDLVYGDCDGVTVVPREHLEEVIAKAEKKGLYEAKRRVIIEEYRTCREQGKPLPELAPDWVLEMMAAKPD